MELIWSARTARAERTSGAGRRRPGRSAGSLRRAALRYASRGWPVLPGTFAGSAAGPHPCERVACPARGAHPAVPGGLAAATVEPDRIARWWSRAGYGIVLPTGTRFDVLDVPAALGAAVGEALVDRRGRPVAPVAATPNGRWQVLVRPGAHLPAELADRTGAMLHGTGSWVVGPPSPLPGGTVRWLVPPRAVGWNPADPDHVQQVMATVVRRAAR